MTTHNHIFYYLYIKIHKGKTGIYSAETLNKMSQAHRKISDDTRIKLSKPKRKSSNLERSEE